MKLQKSKDTALALRNLQSPVFGEKDWGRGWQIEISVEKKPAKVNYVPAR